MGQELGSADVQLCHLLEHLLDHCEAFQLYVTCLGQQLPSMPLRASSRPASAKSLHVFQR